MKIVNNNGMPKVLEYAVKNDKYSKGNSDISVTTLIASAQARVISGEHYHELEEDVEDRMYALLGTAVHNILELAAEQMMRDGVWQEGDFCEDRYFCSEFGKTLSGQIDLFAGGVLYDYKVTSVFSIKEAMKDGKEEWENQLNVLKYIMERQEGALEVKELAIIAIARDWRKGESLRGDYPKKSEKIIIPMWSKEKAHDYIKARMQEHFADVVSPCTPKECWERPPTFKLMKEGRKTSLKNADNLYDVREYALNKGLASFLPEKPFVTPFAPWTVTDKNFDLHAKHEIVRHEGARVKCESYCSASQWCEQYKDWSKQNGS